MTNTLARIAVPESFLSSDGANAPSVLFNGLTGELIKLAAFYSQGAAGPSGVDAYFWRRMCSSFEHASVGVCNSLAAVAQQLCVCKKLILRN